VTQICTDNAMNMLVVQYASFMSYCCNELGLNVLDPVLLGPLCDCNGSELETLMSGVEPSAKLF
jgi:hypothetical protein